MDVCKHMHNHGAILTGTYPIIAWHIVHFQVRYISCHSCSSCLYVLKSVLIIFGHKLDIIFAEESYTLLSWGTCVNWRGTRLYYSCTPLRTKFIPTWKNTVCCTVLYCSIAERHSHLQTCGSWLASSSSGTASLVLRKEQLRAHILKVWTPQCVLASVFLGITP